MAIEQDAGRAAVVEGYPALAAYQGDQEAEYGTYVANQQITKGAAVAYQKGHPVPVSNVVVYRYDERGLVDRTVDANRYLDYEARVRKEWGTYVANQPIWDGDHLVYRAGDRVSVAHAEGRGYVKAGVVDKVKGN